MIFLVWFRNKEVYKKYKDRENKQKKKHVKFCVSVLKKIWTLQAPPQTLPHSTLPPPAIFRLIWERDGKVFLNLIFNFIFSFSCMDGFIWWIMVCVLWNLSQLFSFYFRWIIALINVFMIITLYCFIFSWIWEGAFLFCSVLLKL